MKKTLFLSLILTIIFTGCFSLNPFSDSKEEVKKEIEIPSDAPSWLLKNSIKNYVSSLGISKNIKKEKIHLFKQKALLTASNNLTRRIYIKTVNLFKAYAEKENDFTVFQKDIKKFSEHIALKSLTYSKIKNTWISPDKTLFIQIAVDSNIVAEQIQQTSKLIFKINKDLYHNFLSNRAKKDLIQLLEDKNL